MSKKRVGFRAMDPEKQRAIASKGGKAAHAAGAAHQYTHEEATAAGRLGGVKVGADREHMARIGKLGGTERQRRRRERLAQEAMDTPW